MVHPEATIHHSGMEQPIRGNEEPDYVRAIKAQLPDISLEMRNWAAREDVVFVEYAMEATVGGERIAWDGIGRFKLRDGRVIEAIGRWDLPRSAARSWLRARPRGDGLRRGRVDGGRYRNGDRPGRRA